MNAKLLVVQGRPPGKSISFPPGEYVFGRGAECHVRPISDWVSRQHCLLRVSPEGSLSVSDLGSRNGTLVNGVRILLETTLKNGDQLQVGPLVFEVTSEEAVPTRTPADRTHHETAAYCSDTSTQLPCGEDPGTPSGSAEDATRSDLLLPRPATS